MSETLGINTPTITPSRTSVVVGDNGSVGGQFTVASILGLIQASDLPSSVTGSFNRIIYTTSGAINPGIDEAVFDSAPALNLTLAAGTSANDGHRIALKKFNASGGAHTVQVNVDGVDTTLTFSNPNNGECAELVWNQARNTWGIHGWYDLGLKASDVAAGPTPSGTEKIVAQAGSTDYEYTFSQVSNLTYTLGGLFTKPVIMQPLAVPYAATVTLDATSRNNFIIGATASGTGSAMTFNVTGLTGNLTLANPTGLSEGQHLNIWIPQDVTGSRTITYGSLFLPMDGSTAYVLSTAASAIDLLACVYIMGKLRYVGRKVS